ncbi:MAG: PspC domain-containing protein [Knoellia sp.]
MTQTPHPADGGPTGQPGSATPPPYETPPAERLRSHRMWDEILSSGLRRDHSRQWFAGVCSGIARRVDVDPILIRAAFIALTLFGGLGIVLYLVAWLLLPDDDGRIMAREALSNDGSGSATGAIVLTVIAVLVLAGVVFGDNGFLLGWGILPLALVAWLFWRHQQRKDGEPTPLPPTQTGSTMYAASGAAAVTAPAAPYSTATSPQWQPPTAPPASTYGQLPPQPPRPRRRGAGFPGFALTLGLAAVGYGAGLLLHGPLSFSGSRQVLGLIIGLGAAALTTLVIGLSGRRSILSSIVVATLAFGAVGAATNDQFADNGRGIRSWTPVLSATSPQVFELGAGRSTLDVRPLVTALAAPAESGVPAVPAPTPLPTPQVIEVRQGAGEITILVPAGANARVEAHASFGDVVTDSDLPAATSDRDNGNQDGPSETLTLNVGAAAPTLLIRADITVGQITIKKG